MTEESAIVESQEVIIHLEWDGPMSYEQALTHRDRTRDYGVYQFRGPHPVYGTNVLLYIGKAERQTFGLRLSQERWEGWQTTNGKVEVFLGRLSGSLTPSGATWNELIARTERLLIVSHRPAHNAKDLYRRDTNDFFLHVLNWGNRGSIMPEVSGSRWMGRFAKIPGYGPFGSHATNLEGPAAGEDTDDEIVTDSDKEFRFI